MCFFQAVEVKLGIGVHVSLYHLRGEKTSVIGGMVTEEQLYLCLLFHHDEHTAVDHQIYIGSQYVDHLYCFVHLHPLGHIHQQSVLCQHCVQGGDAILLCQRYFRIVFLHPFGMLGGIFLERSHHHSLGQCLFGLCGSVEDVVDHKVERCAQVGHVTFKGIIGVYGYLQSVQVQPVVRSKEGLHIGIFITLHPFGGEAQCAEMLISLFAHNIHSWCAVLANHVAALFI